MQADIKLIAESLRQITSVVIEECKKNDAFAMKMSDILKIPYQYTGSPQTELRNEVNVSSLYQAQGEEALRSYLSSQSNDDIVEIMKSEGLIKQKPKRFDRDASIDDLIKSTKSLLDQGTVFLKESKDQTANTLQTPMD